MEALYLLAVILFGSLLQSAFVHAVNAAAPVREPDYDQTVADRYMKMCAGAETPAVPSA